MANRKISDLTALTAPASGDLLPIVDISEAASADKNKKITYGELLASIPLGSAASPSIAFEGNINTGIYSPAADYVGISTGGTGRVFVGANGVGIGGSAAVTLDVYNTTGVYFRRGGATVALEIGAQAGSGGSGIEYNVDGTTYIKGRTDAYDLAFKVNSLDRGRFDSSGRFLIGTSSARANFFNTTATAALQIEGNTGNTSTLSIIRNSADVGQPVLLLGKTRGASVGSTAIVQSGDIIGQVNFQGSDGTEFVSAAAISAEVDGTPGANDMPGRLVFYTTANGASSPTEAMRIKSTRIINFSNAPTYADNTAATAGGLAIGDVYKTALGVLMIRS
jgi:hypothetical protein